MDQHDAVKKIISEALSATANELGGLVGFMETSRDCPTEECDRRVKLACHELFGVALTVLTAKLGTGMTTQDVVHVGYLAMMREAARRVEAAAAARGIVVP